MLGIFSCQKDDSFTETEPQATTVQNNEVNVQRLTLNDLIQKQSLNKPLKKMKRLLDVNKTSQGQSRITTTDGSFTVLTDEIVELTTSNSVSYSFLTESPLNPNADYENLVLYQREGEPFKFYLYSYKTIFYDGQRNNYLISKLLIDEDAYGLESLVQIASKQLWSNGCLWDIQVSGNVITITFIFCPGDSSSGTGEGGAGANNDNASPSPNDTCGNWIMIGVANGKCIWTKGCVDAYGEPYVYSINGPCNGDDNSNNEGNNNEGNNNEGNGEVGTGEVGTGESGNTGSGPGPGPGPGPGNPSPPVELEEGENVGVNTPKDYDQQIDLCFSSAGIQFDPSDLTHTQQKALANYLNEDNSNSGTNCSDPQALAFAHEAAQAMAEGGDFDHVNNVILDSTFVANETLNCVYNKLKTDNSSLFSETIGAFINNPSANLIFTVGNCVSTDIACTDDNYFAETGIIKITIENITANPIELAQMILHEAIHAEIGKFVTEYNSGINFNNKPYLFQQYAYYKEWAENIDPNYNWGNAADHQYMITNYINSIANSLRQFDNYRYPLDNYKDYAWNGLRAYDYRGTLTDLDETNYINLRITETDLNIEVCNE